MLSEEILDFVVRRFPIDCHWLDGNCYWFAVILAERFNLDIYYNPIDGHFMAGNKDYVWDFLGHPFLNNNYLLLDDIKKNDESWYVRLERDCMR